MGILMSTISSTEHFKAVTGAECYQAVLNCSHWANAKGTASIRGIRAVRRDSHTARAELLALFRPTTTNHYFPLIMYYDSEV